MMLPVVAIVGRPNVGKSTIFNKIIGSEKAIVHDLPGVTRDRIYEKTKINNKSLLLIDTGGFFIDEKDEIEGLIREQAQVAIEEADLVLAVLDIATGLTPLDKELINYLRKNQKKFLVVVNKVDSKKEEKKIAEFYELGVDEIFYISAMQKKGFDFLLKKIEENIPEVSLEKELDDSIIKIGLLGRPNVGKSSLVNKILGYERVIVSPVPGTTRDAVDSFFTFNEKNYLIIDTAGIRRKSKVSYKLERFSVIRAIATIERSDVILFLLDADEGLTHQDKTLLNLIDKRGKGLLILLNKWDKFKHIDFEEKKFFDFLKKQLSFVNYAPILKISALTGYNVKKIFSYINIIHKNLNLRIQTSQLNDFLENIIKKYSPPVFRGKRVKINYITQVEVCPPKFIVFTNFPEGIKDSYKKYIKNQLRRVFGFEGVPIEIYFKKKN